MTTALRELLERVKSRLLNRPENNALVAELDVFLAAPLSVTDRVYYALDRPRTTTDVQRMTGCTLSHVWNELRRLEAVGLVKQAGLSEADRPRGGMRPTLWTRVPRPVPT